MPIGIVCQQCGSVFYRTPNQKGRAKYCSRQCQYLSQRTPRVSLICENCGKPFHVIQFRGHKAKYCSGDCYRAYIRLHHPYRKERPTPICQHCGRSYKPKSPYFYAQQIRKYCPECYEQRVFLLGKHPTEEVIQKMRKGMRFHNETVIEQAEVLKQQGFEVVIIDKVRPDLIARKNDKVYAVEIELDKPDYDKYQSIKVFDDIIWVLKQKASQAHD